MPASVVRIDYNDVKAVKGLAEDQRERVTQFLQQVNDQVSTLKSDNWVGENADKFYSDMEDTVIPGIERLIKAFSKMEDTCDQLIQVFQAGEEEAQTFFPKS